MVSRLTGACAQQQIVGQTKRPPEGGLFDRGTDYILSSIFFILVDDLDLAMFFLLIVSFDMSTFDMLSLWAAHITRFQ
jgi:hypothetical protein